MNRILAVADVEPSGSLRSPLPVQLPLAFGRSWAGLLSPLSARESPWQPPLDRTNHPLYLLWFSGGVLRLRDGAARRLRRQALPSHPLAVALILGWAVIFRFSVLWVTPGFLSDDIYRYIWDGLVQEAGINPYDYPPGAPELGFYAMKRSSP